MTILTPFLGIGGFGKEADIYLGNPNDENFDALFRAISKDGFAYATQFMYGIWVPKPPKPIFLKHLIAALFYERRFTEALYFSYRYTKEIGQNKDVTVMRSWSRIELGLLHTEENFVDECESAGVEYYRILNIRLGLFLRSGDNDSAHIIAIELFFEPLIEKAAFYNVIEAGLRTSDSDLVASTILKARSVNLDLRFGKRLGARVMRLLRKHLCSLLYVIRKRRI